MYSEIINHYKNNKSNVYSCLLDASKAFDLVYFGKLFRILLSMDIPRCIIRLIFDSYIRQRACVKWNSTKSLYFSIHNGVKQGGVISPIFFNLYPNPMLSRIRKSRIGCHINNDCTGALAYADDVTIICLSLRGFNKMLEICNEYAATKHILTL